MDVQALDIPDVLVLTPRRFSDNRGFFSESYKRSALAAIGIDAVFLQENHSLSRCRGTVRGLHFQLPPMEQIKLVRVVRGAILDVVVDIRRASPTYGRHVTKVISAEAWNQIYVPAGFAHGFCTLEPDTEVVYLVSKEYSPEHDRGLLWNDPALGIVWPVSDGDAVLSDKDTRHPRLADLPQSF